jgi:hypothetical protein
MTQPPKIYILMITEVERDEEARDAQNKSTAEIRRMG